MALVLKTTAAEKSILDIGRFIAKQSQSLDVAVRFLDKIDEKCALYATQPHMGEARPDLGYGIRCFPVDNYVVIYSPRPEGILVLLLVHGSRDIPTVFQKIFR